jgi:hypothetical protein
MWWLISRTTQNSTSKHKNCTIFPLLLREKDDVNMLSGRWNHNFAVILMNMWWLASRITQNTTSKHKNCTIFPLILRESDAVKTPFQPAKTQKMTTLFRTFEFKILKLFLKNKWWLTSRNKQKTISKYKNCTIFPLILRENDVDKKHFQTAKTLKITTFFRTLEFKILRLFFYRTSDRSHPETNKKRLRNIRIAPFFLLSSEN